jgi:mono/diheme cytochrome c family protein
MKRIALSSSLGLAFVAVVFGLLTQATAQFTHRSASESIEVSSYPADIQRGYKMFANKCSECHGLSSSLKQSRSEEGWAAEVHRMQAMASSHIDSREADEIMKFLAYDESHRKAVEREKVSANPGDDPVTTGKQLLEKYGCSACHSVVGQGNTSFALDGIGSRRTGAELKQLIGAPPAGSTMPATTASPDELNAIVAYLATLKNP